MPEAPPSDRCGVAPPVRWPWVLLTLALAWGVWIRVPLVINAASHLDSDLGVDGLTLLEATRGHVRWHYPGTPYIGIGPIFLSLPQALAVGVTPCTLVSGGTVAALLLLVATFGLAWRAFGPAVAAWSLVPLTFASNGTVWLSGRITGGHLTAAFWHAGAFLLLVHTLRNGGRLRSLGLGVWCGLGYYLDSMFLVSLAGLFIAAAGSWAARPRLGPGLVYGLIFAAGFLAGDLPRRVGARLEPYSCYEDQFLPVDSFDLMRHHAGILLRSCLPRLIAGHGLYDLHTDPPPSTVNAASRARAGAVIDGGPDVLAGTSTGLALGLWAASSVALAVAAAAASDRAARWAALGLLVSAAVTVVGFVVNRNIFNSDNYRYLVSLLVPWALGFGLLMNAIARRGTGGRVVAAALTLGLAVVMTGDLHQWYARFGWVDAVGRPVRGAVEDPILAWLDAHPDVTWIEGGYWDVYRLSFLTGGRVRGVPFPAYPNRFPEWRPGEVGRRVLLARALTTPLEADLARRAMAERGRVVLRAPGAILIERTGTVDPTASSRE